MDFLKWHRERRIDLPQTNVDAAYFGSVLWLALIEHPDGVIWEHLQPSVNKMKKLGLDFIDSIVDKETIADVKNSYDEMRSFGDCFLAELSNRRLKSETKDSLAKVGKSERRESD
jgi:hypothetical protein